jgi:hypothetical protein
MWQRGENKSADKDKKEVREGMCIRGRDMFERSDKVMKNVREGQ